MAGETEIEVQTLSSTPEPNLLVLGWMQKWADIKKRKGKGVVNQGEAICSQPEDQHVMVNATTPFGHGNLIYMMLTYTMPKLRYNLSKVEEHMAVSPAYPEMYGRIIAKKKEVEGQIKSGLASAAQAVADYELLKHDERKYREILDYFKEGQKDEHVLRALFVDRIDAHTGEGYSMISMTKRWPTIITDFIRVSNVEKKDRDNVKKIKEKLAVPEAEAVVLKTKNKVYEEWKTIFFPDIKDRYSRVKTLVDTRRKSIDEYREWLKPYVTSLKMMRDTTEIEPSKLFTMAIQPWLKPDSMYWVRVFMWKMLTPEEVGKPGYVEGEIDPYDDFVKRRIPEIEKNYGVKIVETKKEADELKKKGLKDEKHRVLTDDDVIIVREKLEDWGRPEHYECEAKLSKDRYYYCFYDINIISPLFKAEGGKEEIDDWNCELVPYLISQNVLLIVLLEIEAKERWLNKYVKELIGVREVEDKVREEVNKRYNLEEKKKQFFLRRWHHAYRERRERIGKSIDDWWFGFKPKTRRLLKYFMRIGPYETVNAERLSKMYGRYMGSGMTDPLIKYIKTQFGKLSGVQPP
jgi:hypothetical protein